MLGNVRSNCKLADVTKPRQTESMRVKTKSSKAAFQAPVSRKASQAHTRDRLVEVGRKYFLRHGLGGSSVEKIAAEAGFTRGAFYANFSNKDELFVAVLQSTMDTELLNFRTILEIDHSAKDRFKMMREAVGNLVINPTWVLLQAEARANALRNETIRSAVVAQQKSRQADGAELMRQFASQLGLILTASPEEVVEVLGSLAEGLAVRQAISGQQKPERAKQLAMLCFDRLVSVASKS
jgi:AcrR family transcriptional regulator